MPGEQVVALRYQWWGKSSHACGSSHCLDTQMIATHMVEHDHIERRGGRSLFYEPAHMETRRVGSSVHDFMNSPRISVECKHHRLVFREMLDKGRIIHAMRMQERRVELHQIHDVDHAYLQFGQVMPQPPCRSYRLQGSNIPRTGQHHIGFQVLVIARPLPGGKAAPAVPNAI